MILTTLAFLAATMNGGVTGRVVITADNGRVITQANGGGYSIHLERDVRWHGSTNGRISISRAGRMVVEEKGLSCPLLHVWEGKRLIALDPDAAEARTAEIARDITGDGVPDLILTDEPAAGGNAAPTAWYVYSLGPDFRLIQELPGTADESARWEYIAGDPLPVFRTVEGWNAWASHKSYCYRPISTPIVLRYRAGAFRPVPEMMRRPAPEDRALEVEAMRFRFAFQAGCPPEQLPGRMLELMFTSNAPSAYRLLELAWPGDSEDKQAFRTDFEDTVRRSQFWRDLVR